MSDEGDRPEEAPRKRGEAAWKENKQRIAERNERVKRAGKQRRQEHEREQAQARYDAERRQTAQLTKSKNP